jgi:hypothetical protein
MIQRAARALFVAAGLAVALPAAALPVSNPSCGGDDKHGDEEKKKEKNPSIASANPSCGGDHGDDKKGDKKGDDKA